MDDIRKVEVQSDKTSLFLTANFVDALVLCSLQSFSKDSVNVMPGVGEDMLCSDAKIFVEFEFHAANSIGISMKRSRDISAP